MRTIEASAPIYPTVEELSLASDLVAIGRLADPIEEIWSRDPAGPTTNPDDSPSGRPYALRPFQISSVLKGDTADEALVLADDLSKITISGLSTIDPDDRVVLFLTSLPEADYPGLDATEREVFILTTPTDNAVFDVGSSIKPRSADVVGLRPGSKPEPVRLTEEELRAVAGG